LDLATKWSLERKQFGKPICDFQAIQLKLADMAIWVEAMRALVYSATTTAEKGAPNVLLGSIAKAFADETVRSVVSNAVQIYGGYGYSCEYPLESLLRETWGFGIGGGTIDILKVRIASELLNRKFDQRK
jgi:alkylation response protein AidB-like acyl-CoA dehydrogenase